MAICITYRNLGDVRTARYWFEKAVAFGDGDAALELAKLYMVSDKEIEDVKRYLKIAAESDDISPASREEAERLLSEFETDMLWKRTTKPEQYRL